VAVIAPGYEFLLNRGFRNRGSLFLSMQTDLDAFAWSGKVAGSIEKHRLSGIMFELCGEDHREALCRFMEESFPGGWQVSVQRALEGDPPYSVLVAVEGSRVVGAAGPLRVAADGRGRFGSIGTHLDYRRRKIGTVLFHLVCAELKKREARYSTLLTGLHSPAQEIYFNAGFRVRHLVVDNLAKRLG
jgi:GNAT superfamily N-acetyltransferase